MRLKYKLGWLPDIPDSRDVPFASLFRVSQRVPDGVDLRDECSSIEDQGELGSCTGQALVGALEFLELKELGPEAPFRFRDLSRLFVYFNERKDMGTVQEDSGAMLRVGIKTLKSDGVCREELWPYKIARFASKPPDACYREAAHHQVTAYQRLNTLSEMKSCLAMGLPFVFGFSVYEHVMSDVVAKTGKVKLPKKNERLLGGHAVVAVGYRDKSKSFIFRNSWGGKWGMQGYGEIPYAYLESRDLSDDFWCIQSTENNRYAAFRVDRG